MKKTFSNKIFFTLVILVAVSSFIFLPVRPVDAQVGFNFSWITGSNPEIKKTITETIWAAIKKAGTISFKTALRNLVNQIAYDTATWLGTGDSGQKPLYYTQPFLPWLADQGKNAAGGFVEQFSKEVNNASPDGFIKNLDICSPDLSVSIKLSLGLADFSNQSSGIGESRCTLKKIYERGANEIALITKPDYLKNLGETMFNPSTSDVGAALILFGRQAAVVEEFKDGEKVERQTNGGWLNIRSLVSGDIIAPPGTPQLKLKQATDIQTDNFFSQTDDIFVDAANIFLNQLALSAFNKLIGNLSRNTPSNSNSSNFYAQGNTSGVAEINKQNSSLLQARFTDRTDYDILGQLTSCPNEVYPGPTNCVINERFGDAINRGITVGEAVEKNIINSNLRIGYNEQGEELKLEDGIPYRSLLILRKYRIIPVGWEVAAQYIRKYSQETKDVDLKKLLECFSVDDLTYDGYEAEWCRGLIDPHWVLKVPKLYCGMEGNGAQIYSSNIVPSTSGYCAETSICQERSGVTCETDYTTCETDNDCIDDPTYKYCNFNIGKEPQVIRTENYCADEQSCIKENANGSCAYYGYCTEEKRRWTFNQNGDNSCESRNNTCQNFKNESGQEATFLENTLDYSNCDAGQVGCKQYALTGPYSSTTKKITWSGTGNQAYFNKNISSCEASGEGCHQFIRTKDDLDTNLLADGSFEQSSCISTGIISKNDKKEKDIFLGGFIKDVYAADEGDCTLATFTHVTLRDNIYRLPDPNSHWFIRVNAGTLNAGIVNTEVNDGSLSLYIEGEGGLFSQDDSGGLTPFNLLPTDFRMEPDHYYTLSARVFVKEGTVHAGFGYLAADQVESTARNEWQSLRITFYKSATSTINNFYVEGYSGAKFYIDSVKFTKGQAQTDYSDYGSNNVIYEKLMPAYLNSVCYDTSSRLPFTLKANAPEECRKFVKQCAAEEVGCQSYTSVDSGINVTGKVKTADYCPGTCLGYNTFVQQANAFNPKQAAYFIPSTARTCGAQAVGCTAFTNLDKLGEGAEAIEYYSALRQCIKPSVTDCSSFYSWEGSDESGYQLKVYALKKDPETRLGEEPLSTLSRADEALICNEAIFHKLPTEPGYNYDCREFYAQDGTVSYHLYEKTISCSEDCHPYRRELSTESSCRAGGGTWDSSESRCLYYAIPGEGKTCAAANAGCQEYTGNIASNIRNIFSPSVSTFENSDSPTDGWSGGSPSSLSLNLGGNSLSATSLSKFVGQRVTRNKSYTISFLARTFTSATLTSINFVNKDEAVANFDGSGTSLSNEWRLYSFNLSSLDHDVTPIPDDGTFREGEKIRIIFSDTVYIDNIKLTEIPNRYYLIRNSWNTPAECDQDFTGAASPGYMLGCSQYRTVDNSRVNLHSFSELCSDSSAGCEAMIDTYNSSDYKAKLVNDSNNNGVCDPTEKGCIKTPQDTMINVIYDPSKFCGQENKGCQRVGVASSYDGTTTFSDTYLNNDPDRYNTTVCKSDAVGCSKWTSPEGDAYFKDPGNEVCEWKLKVGSTNQYSWYKKDQKRCDGAGPLCSSNADCLETQTCQAVLCAVTSDKTTGLGGAGNRTNQPSLWAGACEAAQAGCSEYIDPLSKDNSNLIFNPDYQNLSGDPTLFEKWTSVGTTEASQTISLFPQTIYTLKGGTGIGAAGIKISCGAGLRVLDSNNEFTPVSGSTSYISGIEKSLQFYVQRPSDGSVSCIITRSDRITGNTVYLRQAIVEYQIKQSLDRVSARGVVNNDTGSVLFNERTQNGRSKQNLVYNADATYDTPAVDGSPPKSSPTPLNANVLLQVKADRTCSAWLACTSYIPDPKNPGKKICLNVGQCDRIAADGSCEHPVPQVGHNQNLTNTQIANLSGYSKVGYSDGDYNSLSDYYNFAIMPQVGDVVDLQNGGFEFSGDWKITGTGSRIINQPGLIDAERLKPFQSYQGNAAFLAPEGRALLKLGENGGEAVQPTESLSFITLVPNSRYVISFYSYSKKPGLKLRFENGIGADTIDLSDQLNPTLNEWKRQAIGFTAKSNSYKLVLEKAEIGDAYIDEVRIEPALNFRCSDPENESLAACSNPEGSIKPEFIGSSCRLYPASDSLACRYTDENQVTYAGIRGYCLEQDPKNPAVCLMWYPTDRILSNTGEEINTVNFQGKDLYYCVDAKDECNGTNANFFCNQFVKVNNTKFWNKRLSDLSSFTLPPSDATSEPLFEPAGSRFINFGANGGKLSIDTIKKTFKTDYFGAYLSATDLVGSYKLSLTRDGTGLINNFFPYYGTVSGQLCSAGEEVIEGDWSDWREQPSINKYDQCYTEYAEADEADDNGDGWCRGGSHASGLCSDRSFQCKTRTFYNYQDQCYGSYQSNLGVQCDIVRKSDNYWTLRGWNNNSGSDSDIKCLFDCYNQAQGYKIAKTINTAFEAVKRLFMGRYNIYNEVTKTNTQVDSGWSLYTVPTLGSTYGASAYTGNAAPILQCSDNRRPPYPNDYCYVLPVLSDFRINGLSDQNIVVSGSEYKTFSFSTNTDSEQLPLKKIIIYLGYLNQDGTPEKRTIQGNFSDLNPRSQSFLYDYGDIKDMGTNTLITGPECGGGATTSCYIFRPEITIIDSWGYNTTLPFSHKIIVRPENS